MENPIHPYGSASDTPVIVRIAGAIASVVAIYTIFIYGISLPDVLVFTNADEGTTPELPRHYRQMVGLAAFWAVFPPIWFWYEYYWVYLRLPDDERGSFEGLRYGQQLATAIWASMLVVQGIVLTALF